MTREENEAYRVWDNMLRERGLNFYFVDPAEFENALLASGLANINMTDRTDAFTSFAAASKQRAEGELKPALQTSLGDDGYRAFLNWTQVRYSGLNNGAMWYQHFRGQKTAARLRPDF